MRLFYGIILNWVLTIHILIEVSFNYSTFIVCSINIWDLWYETMVLRGLKHSILTRGINHTPVSFHFFLFFNPFLPLSSPFLSPLFLLLACVHKWMLIFLFENLKIFLNNKCCHQKKHFFLIYKSSQLR